MRITPTEHDIQSAILEWINCIPEFSVWRSNTGAMLREYGGKKRFVRFGRPGSADLTGIGPGGRRIEIEIKRPGQKLSTLQSLFLAEIRAGGGIAFCASSIEDCERELKTQCHQNQKSE